MGYEVKTPAQYFTGDDEAVRGAVERLLDEWLASAVALVSQAADPVSQRYATVQSAYTDVLSLPSWDAPALTRLVDGVLAAARGAAGQGDFTHRVAASVTTVTECMARGLPPRPADHDEETADRPHAWDLLAEELSRAFGALTDLLREEGSIRAKADSCVKVLGQLLTRVDDHDAMLLLLQDGRLLALALATTDGVSDLLVEPAALAAGQRGAGGALMEYIVRRARAHGKHISLIPLDSSALRAYTAWGFTGGMRGMSLLPTAAEAFLARRQDFVRHPFG